jgi:hypothetical protein
VLVNNRESLPIINLIRSATASVSGLSSTDLYHLPSDDKEYLMSKHTAEMTPGGSECAVHMLTTTRLYFNPLPKAPKNSWQMNPNLYNYPSDPMEISSTFWIPVITHWYHQQE